VKSRLGYVKRNLSHIEKLSANGNFGLRLADAERLEVIKTLYRQQNEMLSGRKRKVDDRIVSLSQPHVRPIVRGKASANMEFGAKLSVSLVDGTVGIDRLSWDAFNESEDLIPRVEACKKRNRVKGSL